MLKKIIFLSMAIISSFFTRASLSFAETNSPYSVSPIFSQHQTKEVKNFYDIRWTPNESDHIGLVISNNTAVEKTYQIQLNKARTNKNGIIDYSDPKNEDADIVYKLTEMLIIQNEVTVGANSNQAIEGKISFPNEEFNGILMGGLHISEKNTHSSDKTVSNTVAYNLPIIIRGSSDERPAPKILLEQVTVEKISSDGYALNIELNNMGPNLLKEVAFQAKIKDKQGKIVETQKSKIDITPQTTFIYPVKLTNVYKSGDYQLELVIKHKKGNEWTFTEKFPVNDPIIINTKEVSKKEPANKLAITGLLGILLVTSLVIVFKCLKSSQSKEVK